MPKVTIDSNKCTGCQACVGACPKSVIEMGEDGKAKVVRPADCDGCRSCEGVLC